MAWRIQDSFTEEDSGQSSLRNSSNRCHQREQETLDAILSLDPHQSMLHVGLENRMTLDSLRSHTHWQWGCAVMEKNGRDYRITQCEQKAAVAQALLPL